MAPSPNVVSTARPRLAAVLAGIGGAHGVRKLGRDHRADRVQARDAGWRSGAETDARRVVGGAREEREQHLVGRQADSESESQITVVRDEDVLAALERHCGAGLNGFVALTRRRKRNLPLAVELEAAVLEHPLHEHDAEHRDQLFVGQRLGFGRSVGHEVSVVALLRA